MYSLVLQTVIGHLLVHVPEKHANFAIRKLRHEAGATFLKYIIMMAKTMNQTKSQTESQAMRFENRQLGLTVRVMMTGEGEPMFVGKDVAAALGYSNTRDALSKHVDLEDKTTVAICDTGTNYKSHAVVINESGLYSLVLSSKLPQARAFKRWVTSEVLPQVRRTGGYIPTRDAEGRPLSDEQVMALSNSIMQRTIARKNLPADGCMTATEVAKALGLGDEAKLLNKMLCDRGIIHWAGGRYRLTAQYEDFEGLDGVRFFNYYTRQGQHRERPYQVWTQQGVEFLKEELKKN